MNTPSVSVVNLGCRVNRVESDRICRDLSARGLALVDEAAADLVVINTCAVTGEAEAKTRKAVRHALGLPRGPHVVVTGCVVNLHPDELCDLSPRVVAEPSKVDVADRVCELLSWDPDTSFPGCLDPERLLGRSRLGVKIQDGCNNRCTYCIVWKARGPERSVPVEAVLEQVRAAEAAGVPEVVLTGVNLGAYSVATEGEASVGLVGLIESILGCTGIPQIRLSSIEPMDVTDELIDCMAAHGDRIAPFLHLPVQSGCSATLARMGRPYTTRDFEETVARIRDRVPACGISGDLIVGFPGETESEFADTRSFVERVGFSRLHVFRYSARPGTPAASMPGQVAPEVMASRSASVRDLVAASARSDARSRIGTCERAVLEYGNRGTLGSFHRVVVDGVPEDASSGILEVQIESIDEAGVLHARPVAGPSR
ncbi:MAG: MiaB/RimO family radical SAM methylthiotransferase [Collinsella phocaeensis]